MRANRPSYVDFALAVFLGAFLIFQVQPLMGKYILPWFGGAPAVWTTCMLFFQAMLFAGYCYAHFSVSRLTRSQQGLLHGGLLLATLVLLPIIPSSDWKLVDAEQTPTLRILLLLLTAVGGPYLILSATAPLLQSWYHAAGGKSPFRLYALSNIGSLLALVSYPIAIETNFNSATQAMVWSGTYAGYALLCGWCALQWKKRAGQPAEDLTSEPSSADFDATEGSPKTAGSEPAIQAISTLQVILWLCLSACGSLMLLATTNELCQDVAPIPFLWVLPLALYLLTFVICFEHERWYHRDFWGVCLIVGVIGACVVHLSKANVQSIPISVLIFVYAFVLFVTCMTCHGELTKLKPHASQLTLFYLAVSLGGVLGGLFVALVAPAVFDRFHEFPLGIILTCVLAVATRRFEDASATGKDPWRAVLIPATSLSILAAISAVCLTVATGPNETLLEARRNFYGTLRVTRMDVDEPQKASRSLAHGSTVHGKQYEAEEKKGIATTYYSRGTGVAYAVESHPIRENGGKLNVGVIGLGCGTLSSYMSEGESLTYFEIDRTVLEMADKYFTFNQDARRRGANISVDIGDGRLLLQRKSDAGESYQFDLLVVDAFSSDAIPVHLLTQQCFELYWQHVKPNGILAIHISNRHLDLSPVVRTLAARFEKSAVLFQNALLRDARREHGQASDWVLVTSNDEFMEKAKQDDAYSPWKQDTFTQILWTDSFSNLLQVLR